MPESLTAGFFPYSGNLKSGVVRAFAWQAPEFGPPDRDIRCRPKLFPLLSILVEREANEYRIGKPVVRYSNGDVIGPYVRGRLPKGIQNRIERAIRDTRRIAGGPK